MRKIFLFILFIAPLFGVAQERESLQNVVSALKDKVVIDSTDKSIIVIMDKLFEEGLQANNPQYKPETLKEFQAIFQQPNLKNMHIMALFMIYQNHITESLNSGKKNPQYQVEVIDILIKEAKEIYGQIPVMLYIYQVEAYNSLKDYIRVAEILKEARAIYPNAIPLKVYAYLNNKDELLKNDIVANHIDHWMIKQFKIN